MELQTEVVVFSKGVGGVDAALSLRVRGTSGGGRIGHVITACPRKASPK